MSWASHAIEALARGETVTVTPRGHSMRGRIDDGRRVRIGPIVDAGALQVDDIVLCRVAGHDYLHLVKATRGEAASLELLIGNNRGGLNGWVRPSAVFGRFVGFAEGL